MNLNKVNLAIIGLGYVGLPLAIEFGKFHSVIAFDIDESRIDELKSDIDTTLEVSSGELAASKNIIFTSNKNKLKEANCYIVTVPTPIDNHKKPILDALLSASKIIGEALDLGDIVIYESTVYPGCTEDDCVPILEHHSNLKFNKQFFCGYSPERINPGDKKHRLPDIKKVTSGSTQATAEFVNKLYEQIISAGTHKAESIKIAEASKVIENIQRDLNIALVNELSIIFNKLGIDTESVLEAAETKWNFMPFRPGLVGGHCIGVDPYYLTHKAQEIGYYPQIILSGRRLNDTIGTYITSQLVKLMIEKYIPVRGAKVLIMGFSFKENCPDIRNTRIASMIVEMKEYGLEIDVYDPWVDEHEVFNVYKIKPVNKLNKTYYDAIILAVSHREFQEMGVDKIRSFGKEKSVIYDLKSILRKNETDLRL